MRREEFDPYIKDKLWTCAHCLVHYLAPVVRKGAIDHCKASYVPFISSPVLLHYLVLVLVLALTVFLFFFFA